MKSDEDSIWGPGFTTLINIDFNEEFLPEFVDSGDMIFSTSTEVEGGTVTTASTSAAEAPWYVRFDPTTTTGKTDEGEVWWDDSTDSTAPVTPTPQPIQTSPPWTTPTIPLYPDPNPVPNPYWNSPDWVTPWTNPNPKYPNYLYPDPTYQIPWEDPEEDVVDRRARRLKLLEDTLIL